MSFCDTLLYIVNLDAFCVEVSVSWASKDDTEGMEKPGL